MKPIVLKLIDDCRVDSVVLRAPSFLERHVVAGAPTQATYDVRWKSDYVRSARVGRYGRYVSNESTPYPTSYEKIRAIEMAEAHWRENCDPEGTLGDELPPVQINFAYPYARVVRRCACGWWAERAQCYDCSAMSRFATMLSTRQTGKNQDRAKLRKKTSDAEIDLQLQRAEQLSLMYAKLAADIGSHAATKSGSVSSFTELFSCEKHPGNIVVMIKPHVPECETCREQMIPVVFGDEDDEQEIKTREEQLANDGEHLTGSE